MSFGRNAILGGLLAAVASCAQQEVTQQLERRVKNVGEVYSNEVNAQSPFQKVSFTWNQARELMTERNPKLRQAVKDYNDALVEHSLVKNLTGHLGGSMKKTVSGTLSPKQLSLIAQKPVSELPKHFESLASIKDFSHDMESKQWKKLQQTVVSKQQIRVETVKLYAYFKQYQVLEEKRRWLAKHEDVTDPKVKSSVARLQKSYRQERAKWLDAVRDFYNAEYFDVELRLTGEVMPTYASVQNPNFDDWKRWRVLGREKESAGKALKYHEKTKPMIPGTKMVKNKLGDALNLNLNMGEDGHMAESDQSMRDNVRAVLRSWRLLKEAQADVNDFEGQLEKVQHRRKEITMKAGQAKVMTVAASSGEGEEKKEAAPKVDPAVSAALSKLVLQELALQQKIWVAKNKELQSAAKLWLIDETCW